MNILITGAQFGNKGAQSLLFSVTNEIRKRYDDVKLFFLPCDEITKYDLDKLKYIFVYDDQASRDCDDFPRRVHRFVNKVIIEAKIKQQIKNERILLLSNVWNKIDLLLDISGFNLSSKFTIEINNRYLRYLKEASRNGIPIILMPQSFGPFDYKKKRIHRNIKSLLSNVDIICAREKDGAEQLKRVYNLENNVYVYPDLVLTSGKIDYKKIYNFEYIPKYPEINTHSNVGIVPNEQLLSLGDESSILSLYEDIISYLKQKEKNVYIFRHSNDLEFCKKIYNRCKNIGAVLIEEDFDCEEYALFVKQFDYIIASRFHSIVHAYKNSIPALILGWSVKYNCLAGLFGQDEYVFNVTNTNYGGNNNVLDKLTKLNQNYLEESNCIGRNMERINKHSCYEQLWMKMDSINEKNEVKINGL